MRVSRLRRALVVGTALAVTAVLGVPASAATDGSVVVSRGTSSQYLVVTPLEGSPDGHLLASVFNRYSYDEDLVLLDSAAAPVGLGTVPGELVDLSGGLVWADDSRGTASWHLTTGGSWHSCDYKELGAPVGYGPDSVIVLDDDGTGLKLSRLTVDTAALTCTTSAIGTWVNAGEPSAAEATATGFVLATRNPDTGTSRTRYYPFADPAHPVALSQAGHSAPGAYEDFYVDSSVAVWRGGDYVVRSPLSGAAATSYKSLGDGHPVGTSNGAAWVDADHKLRWVTAGSTTIKTSSFTTTGPEVAVAGSRLVVTRGSTPATAGLYYAASAADTAHSLYVPGAPKESVGEVALMGGRLVYRSDKGSAGHWSVYRRTVRKSSGALTVSAASLIARTATGSGLSTSGHLATFGTGTDVAVGTLDDNGQRSSRAFGVEAQVSGNRVLYRDAAGDFHVRDLVSGHVTHLNTDAYEAALFGNYAVYLLPSGAIRRRNLKTDTYVTVAGATTDLRNTLSTWGNEVAWHDATNRSLVVKSVSSGDTHTLPLPAFYPYYAQVTAGHVAFSGYTDDGGSPEPQLRTWRYRSASTSSLVSTDVSLSAAPAIDDEQLAWVRGNGSAQVAPLPAFGSSPRYLGSARAEAAFTPGASTDKTWSLQVPVTKPLTTCTVTIKRSGTLVDTVTCSSSTYGDVRATWDGHTSGGGLAKDGTYTWRLTGKDSDGSLLYYDGSTAAITGTLTLS